MFISVLLFFQVYCWLGEAGEVSKNLEINGSGLIDITEAPFQVSIYRKGHQTCQGALIAKDIVLTTASCFRKRDNATFYKVRAGSSFIGEGGEYRHVSKVIRHPHVHRFYPVNDVAVMWLSEPLTFSDKITALPMKDKDEEVKEGEVTQVTTWGRYPDLEKTMNKLRKIMVQTANATECVKGSAHRLTPQMMCVALRDEDDYGFCGQDSGAPLVHNGKLAGLASWVWRRVLPRKHSIRCTRYPVLVYTKVSAMRSWIDETIQNNTSI
ncbi:hypothetical protein ABMA28_010102 [Loxostege sticticalis]|uniref:Peptidase S1 domain-containing protein n=1 Tax=Loxostege sticticalis TaxID=481309 RepID=A0ABD0S9Q1_LOXSC